MDAFETPYEEEAEFIQCTVCDKSIRGETLYKIHLTTPGHLKKEDGFVSAGLAVRQQTIPMFEDIIQYLDYMKLDEPIIGLNYLEEMPCNDLQGGPRYTCKLCHQTANLPETVRHVIGRKHRQKYVELKRPDLVTWDKQSIINQGGKIIRARAEIIERQDGRGTPTAMMKNKIVGQLNISRVPSRQNQNRGRNISQSSTHRDVPSHLPRLMDYQDEFSHQERFPPGHSTTPPFHPEDAYMMNRDRPMYQQEDTVSRDRMEVKLQGAEHGESDEYRREYLDPDYCRELEGEFVPQDPQRRAGSGGCPRYDSRDDVLQTQAHHEDYYRDEAPPYRRPYPERDLLKEFYSEEVRRRRVLSAEHQPPQPGNQEGDNRGWSLDRDSGRHDIQNRPGRQDPSEAESKRRSFPTQREGERSSDSLFHMIRDYSDEMREPHHEEEIPYPGPSRTGPPKPQRIVEVSRTMSEIPEPFRRFLKGGSNEEGQNGKRKRKSRFSDATAEEVKMTKDMFSNEYGPPNPKYGGRPRPALGTETHRTQRPDMYMQSQSTHHTGSDQREGSDSGGVFDALKNIEIENAEEANFLKSKLCDLLKEFKTKKSEKSAGQISQGRAVISKDYDSFKQDRALAPRRQYEPVTRQDSDLRRPEDLYFQEDQRGRGWDHEELIVDERLRDYNSPVRGEPRQANRRRYEEVFGLQEKSRTSHATHPDETAPYPERFQEPMHPRDYRPASADEFLGSNSSAPPLSYDRGPRMDRGPRFSNNLDKITSTLLELVSRK